VKRRPVLRNEEKISRDIEVYHDSLGSFRIVPNLEDERDAIFGSP
jgi:hypothetical protein